MVKIEHKRARLLFRIGETKLEWTIEPRYWRNPLIAVGFLLIASLCLSGVPDLITVITVANMYACVAIPLSWQMAGLGRMNFGPQLFVGIGGFVAALASVHLGWGPWMTLPLVIVAGFAFSLIISPIVNIAKGLYFTLITFIMPLIFLEVTFYYGNIFKGETGIFGVTPLFSLGSLWMNNLAGCLMSLLIMLVFLFIIDKVLRSRIGLYSAAINDDEDVAYTMGLDIRSWKIICFVVTSTMMTVTGWFFAHYFTTMAGVTYLTLPFMMKVVLMVMIGGRGELYGAVVGGYFIAFLEHFLKSLGPVHYILFPLILIIMVAMLPEGLYGIYRKRKYKEYYPTIRLRKRDN